MLLPLTPEQNVIIAAIIITVSFVAFSRIVLIRTQPSFDCFLIWRRRRLPKCCSSGMLTAPRSAISSVHVIGHAILACNPCMLDTYFKSFKHSNSFQFSEYYIYISSSTSTFTSTDMHGIKPKT